MNDKMVPRAIHFDINVVYGDLTSILLSSELHLVEAARLGSLDMLLIAVLEALCWATRSF